MKTIVHIKYELGFYFVYRIFNSVTCVKPIYWEVFNQKMFHICEIDKSTFFSFENNEIHLLKQTKNPTRNC